MIALIDGDVVTYSSSFAAQKKYYSIGCTVYDSKRKAEKAASEIDFDFPISEEVILSPESHALSNAKELITKILDRTKSTEYIVYITASGVESNYRYKLDTTYKANRKEQERPVHYGAVRNYLTDTHGAKLITGKEADDAMGIRQWDHLNTENSTPTIICTVDKDLDMIPGLHYNWRKDVVYEVDDRTALRNFYKQLLIGDPTDNIKGIKGIGPVTADKILPIHYSESQMYDVVLSKYKHQYRERSIEAILNIVYTTANLLWIQREEGILWQPPN